MPVPMAQYETMASRGDSFEADRRLSVQQDRPISPRMGGATTSSETEHSDTGEASPHDYASVCIGASHSSPANRRKQSSQFLERTRSVSGSGLLSPRDPPCRRRRPQAWGCRPSRRARRARRGADPERCADAPGDALHFGIRGRAQPPWRRPVAAVMSASSSDVDLPGPGPDTVCNQGRLLAMAGWTRGSCPRAVRSRASRRRHRCSRWPRAAVCMRCSACSRSTRCWRRRTRTAASRCTAEAGRLEMAQLLAQAGAQARSRDHDGWEPLHYAVTTATLRPSGCCRPGRTSRRRPTTAGSRCTRRSTRVTRRWRASSARAAPTCAHGRRQRADPSRLTRATSSWCSGWCARPRART